MSTLGSNCNPDLRTLLGRRPKVIIGHPMLGRGGSEARVVWLAEALKQDCEVSVVTTRGWDLHLLNEYYGTRLAPGDVTVRYAPFPHFLQGITVAALRGALYQRFARRIAPEYDIRISAYNFTDWGMSAIHFVADFSWDSRIRSQLHPQAPGLCYRDSLVRRAYLGLAKLCSAPSGRNLLRDDRIVTNSHWTAATLSCDGSAPSVVYPAVWSTFPEVAWDEKDNSFVILGRVAPEKRIEEAIAIVHALRRRGHLLTLHICGSMGSDKYSQSLTRLCDVHGDWITRSGHVAGKRKMGVLAGSKFGISTCRGEAFGIAVAEMVKAGAIVFAAAEGGPAEILDNPFLTFRSEAEAIAKIESVLLDTELQNRLRVHLANRAGMFGADAFMAESRRVIAESLVCEPAVAS